MRGASQRFEWDTGKAAANAAKHGLSFELAEGFDWLSALYVEDDRYDYGERRFLAFGEADGGLFLAIVFTPRGDVIRLISLRRMNDKEVARYERHKAEAAKEV